MDYSQTINRFTYLDAFHIPKIEDLAEVSRYTYFSSLDLKSAYCKIALQDDEKHFTAFEANGRLYQFRRVVWSD